MSLDLEYARCGSFEAHQSRLVGNKLDVVVEPVNMQLVVLVGAHNELDQITDTRLKGDGPTHRLAVLQNNLEQFGYRRCGSDGQRRRGGGWRSRWLGAKEGSSGTNGCGRGDRFRSASDKGQSQGQSQGQSDETNRLHPASDARGLPDSSDIGRVQV